MPQARCKGRKKKFVTLWNFLSFQDFVLADRSKSVQPACITSDPVMEQHVNHRDFDLELAQCPAHIYFIFCQLVEGVFFEVAENHFLITVSIIKNKV